MYIGKEDLEYMRSENKMELGEKTVDLMGYSVRIIVGNQIIDNDSLNWRETEQGGLELTLNEIAEQIKTPDVIFVWIELGLRGEIFLYNNYGDEKWYEHGSTKGFA
ncbi:hypothetical protein GCM10011409_00030 [Lentibacillus populi]|uniref:Uncharacterized protein n=1 Tax=Lentibacillus populi TaxID=1827502 RepID=A0A9W5TU46_9BACI|nr:hypothetical protein [Lentibacillus populi]GGB26718.1 hypothetical protein GCM10011409_00030 [Lentibacillus populi]